MKHICPNTAVGSNQSSTRGSYLLGRLCSSLWNRHTFSTCHYSSLPWPHLLANPDRRPPWWNLLLIAYLLLQLQLYCALVQIFSASAVQACILGWRWDNAVRFWVCNVGKLWQKLSLIGLEWSTLKSNTKNSSSRWKKWVTIYFVQLVLNWLKVIWLVLDRLKVAYQQKINKRKKPITWPFEAQIASHFF